MPLVLIALGGAAGAVCRYLIDTWVAERAASAFPLGTLVVNVSGSLVLGFLFALAVDRDVLPTETRPALMIGFAGAYTTFSTLTLESWRLVESGSIGLALANLLGSLGLGMLALVGGLVVGRALA